MTELKLHKIILLIILSWCCFSMSGPAIQEFTTSKSSSKQTASKPREAIDKPNFILIVADDLGFADLSLNGSTQIKTPNIDKLAREGVSFSDGYVSSPVCSPSRAGFLTGRNQVKFGHDNNIGGNQPGFDPQFLGLPLSQKTIADHLKPLDYTSGLIGK